MWPFRLRRVLSPMPLWLWATVLVIFAQCHGGCKLFTSLFLSARCGESALLTLAKKRRHCFDLVLKRHRLAGKRPLNNRSTERRVGPRPLALGSAPSRRAQRWPTAPGRAPAAPPRPAPSRQRGRLQPRAAPAPRRARSPAARAARPGRHRRAPPNGGRLQPVTPGAGPLISPRQALCLAGGPQPAAELERAGADRLILPHSLGERRKASALGVGWRNARAPWSSAGRRAQ